MKLTDRSLKQPLGVLIIAALIVLWGLIAFTRLPLQLLPAIEQPQITVTTQWPGAGVEEIEANIVEPLEYVLRGIEDLQVLTSDISPSTATTTLVFPLNVDTQSAMLNVVNQLNQMKPLPPDAIEPVVKVGGGGLTTVATLLLSPLEGEQKPDFADHQAFIETEVESRLRQIPGVSAVNLASYREPRLTIEFDPYRAAALGITIDHFSQFINDMQDRVGGVGEAGKRDYTVRFTAHTDPQNLSNRVLTYQNGSPILLGDVAQVKVGPAPEKGFIIRNGKVAYYIIVERNPKANSVEILENMKTVIAEINQASLNPAGFELAVSFDASVHIRRAIELVQGSLQMGVMLTLLILYGFLRNLRRTLIIAATIPVSLSAAIIVLSVQGYTLNVVSLAGLAFSVGLVLDAAIIVVERISAMLEQGAEFRDAVVNGVGKISNALIASTTTTVCIFAPIYFMEGVAGQMFADLSITIITSVSASLLVALTLIPLLYFLLNDNQSIKRQQHQYPRLNKVMQLAHTTFVARSAILALFVAATAWVFYKWTPQIDFLPKANSDGIIAFMTVPNGSNVKVMEREFGDIVVDRLKPYYEQGQSPQIKSYIFSSFDGANVLFVYPKDVADADALITLVREEILAGLFDVQPYVARRSLLTASLASSKTIEMNLSGLNQDSLAEAAVTAKNKINDTIKGLSVRITPDINMAQPQLLITPKEHRIRQAGVTYAQVSAVVKAVTDGSYIGDYFNGNKRLKTFAQTNQWHTPEALGNIPIWTPNAGIVTLAELTDIQRSAGPSKLLRVNGEKTITVLLNVPDDIAMGPILDQLRSEVAPQLKQQYSQQLGIEYRGSADKLENAVSSLTTQFFYAILVLSFVLLISFRSLLDTALVLSCIVPVIAAAFVGLVLLNLIQHQSLDLLTMTGLTILIGLVVNNSILLIEQTRENQAEGAAITEAVIKAANQRLRAILMSTLTSIVGVLPLLLNPGAGSDIYRGLACVIATGMVMSLILSFTLLPSLIITIEPIRQRIAQLRIFSPNRTLKHEM